MHLLPSRTIIDRYILREIGVPFLVAIFVFTGILFLARSLKLIDLVVNKNVPVTDILVLFSYIIPRFLELAIPMSLFLAVIIGFGRLSADSELVVLRAVGMSLNQLAVPVMWFAAMALGITLVLGLWVRPWANYQLGKGLFEIAKMQTSAGLVAGTFNELGQLTVYAETIEDKGAKLNNVLIGDSRDPASSRTFIAKYGRLVSNNTEQTLMLQLFDGSIQEGRGQTFNVTRFEVNTIRLPHSELLEESPEEGGKRSGEMYISELLAAKKEAIEKKAAGIETRDKHEAARIAVELHRRFALPGACVCVALIAMSLGIQPSRGGHTWGPTISVVSGILLILLYYVLLAAASALAEEEVLPVAISIWTPNILFFALGFWVFRQVGSERWLAVTQALGDTFSKALVWLRLERFQAEGSAS